jgi:hypothetical protein
MRTLAKTKPIKPMASNPPTKGGLEKKEGKTVSKKVMKTVFHSPFRYKM